MTSASSVPGPMLGDFHSCPRRFGGVILTSHRAFHVAPPTSGGPWKVQENLEVQLKHPVRLRPHSVITWAEPRAGGGAERGQAMSCP